MSVYGKKTRNPGWQPGNHWVDCMTCSHTIRHFDAKKTWDGLVVCPDCWEPRHPQDFVRGVPDDSRAKGLVHPEPATDSFTTVTRASATSSVPSGTFGDYSP